MNKSLWRTKQTRDYAEKMLPQRKRIKFHNVQPGIDNMQAVQLPKKAHTSLVTPKIPNSMPLFMDIVPNIAKL